MINSSLWSDHAIVQCEVANHVLHLNWMLLLAHLAIILLCMSVA